MNHDMYERRARHKVPLEYGSIHECSRRYFTRPLYTKLNNNEAQRNSQLTFLHVYFCVHDFIFRLISYSRKYNHRRADIGHSYHSKNSAFIKSKRQIQVSDADNCSNKTSISELSIVNQTSISVKYNDFCRVFATFSSREVFFNVLSITVHSSFRSTGKTRVTKQI